MLSKNNKGTSLIELIVGIAISAIVISMIMFFIKVAADSFKRSSDDVNLQMEAQTAVNQLANIAMEATSSPKLEVSLTDIIYIFTYTDTKHYVVIFNKEDGLLYLMHVSDVDDVFTLSPNIKEHLMAEYVKELEISSSANGRKVTINLVLTLDKAEYGVTKNIRLRNVNEDNGT